MNFQKVNEQIRWIFENAGNPAKQNQNHCWKKTSNVFIIRYGVEKGKINKQIGH